MVTGAEHRRPPTVAAVLYAGAGHEHLGIDFSPLAVRRAGEKARWWSSTAHAAPEATFDTHYRDAPAYLVGVTRE